MKAPGVTRHKDVLSRGLIERIKMAAQGKREHRLNLTSWPANIVDSSGAILLFDMPDDIVASVKEELADIVGREYLDQTWAVTYTLGSRLSYIAWHNDSHQEVACTVYLNNEWNMNWGGCFIYENAADDLRAIYPAFNTGIVLHPPVLHTTTMPTIHAPLRESLQVFVNKNGGSYA